jgi:rRNA-processing protein FCF1
MAPPLRTPQRQIALDTNFLIGLAAGDERCWEALEDLGSKVPRPALLAPPTVALELSWLHSNGETAEKRQHAGKALHDLLSWGITLIQLAPAYHGVADAISEKILSLGILPPQERHDSLIIAESALLGCDIIVTSDEAMIHAGQNQDPLRRILQDAHALKDTVAIVRPISISRWCRAAGD